METIFECCKSYLVISIFHSFLCEKIITANHLCGERVEMGPLLTKRNTTSNMAKATSSTSTALISLSITQYLKNQGQTYYVIKLSYFPRFRTNNVPRTVAIFLSFVQLSCPSNGLQLFFLTFKTETTS